jgi:hypothetical protein
MKMMDSNLNLQHHSKPSEGNKCSLTECHNSNDRWLCLIFDIELSKYLNQLQEQSSPGQLAWMLMPEK